MITAMTQVDLYLGGDLGIWALEQVQVEHVGQVLTLDGDIAALARASGVRVWTENANKVGFEPSPVAFSVHYPRILKPPLVDRYRRIYNLHPGYLPWGRGFYPIFWGMWEQTPVGATLHEITPGIDEGPIVAQRQVEVRDDDTGASLFERVRTAEKAIFDAYWPRIVSGESLPTMPQPPGGSYHSKQDFYALKQGADWSRMAGADLIRLIRCLSFPGYTGLEIELSQQRFELSLRPLPSNDSNK